MPNRALRVGGTWGGAGYRRWCRTARQRPGCFCQNEKTGYTGIELEVYEALNGYAKIRVSIYILEHRNEAHHVRC